MTKRKPAIKSKTERKLDLIFETLLHISNKLMTQEELNELSEALTDINGSYKS